MTSIDPLGIWKTAVEDANALGLKIQAATANQDDQVKAVLDTSDDAKVVKFREAKAKVLEQIETLKAQVTNAEANIKEHARTLLPSFDADFNVEEAKKEFAAKRKNANDARKALLMFVDEETLNKVAQEHGIVEVVSVRGTGVAKGQTGIRRARLSSATHNGNVVEKDGKVDFTLLAKESKVSADDLKAAAYKAAGTDDLNSLGGGAVVNFTVGDNQFSVTISDKKPGRPKGSKNTPKDDTSAE